LALKKEDKEVKFCHQRIVKRGEKGRLWRVGTMQRRRKEEDEEKWEGFFTFFLELHFCHLLAFNDHPCGLQPASLY
jgi:hypothetical protein